MWVVKLRIQSVLGGVGEYAVKHGIDISGYPLRYWKSKGALYVLVAGTLWGTEQNKQAFVEDMRRQGLFTQAERAGDFLIATLKSLPINEPLYDPEIIWIKPGFISHEGYQVWDLASWKRTPIDRLITMAHKTTDSRVLKLAQEKIGAISMVSLAPELTTKQLKALRLAVQQGYYEYPRKVDLVALAKLSGVSYATYNAHIRKAERALLPFFLGRFK